MALTDGEMAALRKACVELKDGPDYRCDDYVANLINMALDFQMHSKTVDAATSYFEKTHGAKTHDDVKALLEKFPNTKEGNLALANLLWNNNHWTRAKLLRKLVECLEAKGVHDQTSLKEWLGHADFKNDVKGQFRTDDHSIGITLFHWWQLRSGIDTVKPDVHVLTFVSNAIGRSVTARQAITALTAIAKSSGRQAYRFDSAIWHHQRDKPMELISK